MDKDQQKQYEDEVSLAAIGKQVLDNAAYQSAIMERKAHIFDVFCKTNSEQSDVREEAWRTMQNLLALEQYLKTALETGKMAQATLDIHTNPQRN